MINQIHICGYFGQPDLFFILQLLLQRLLCVLNKEIICGLALFVTTQER